MGDALDILQLHHRVREQAQGPTGMAFRRIATAQGYQFGLKVAVYLVVIVAVERAALHRRLQTFFHKPLLDPVYRPHVYTQNLTYLLI